MLYISGVSGHAGAQLSKRAGTRTIQWLMGTSVKCRSNERLRSRGASRNEPMAFEMPMTWHERRWNQWINETKESMHDKWWLNKWSTPFWTWNRPRAHLAMPRACGYFHMFWTKSSSRYRCSSLVHFLRHLCQIETHTRGNTDLPLANFKCWPFGHHTYKNTVFAHFHCFTRKCTRSWTVTVMYCFYLQTTVLFVPHMMTWTLTMSVTRKIAT